jgi:hypothetical protein
LAEDACLHVVPQAAPIIPEGLVRAREWRQILLSVILRIRALEHAGVTQRDLPQAVPMLQPHRGQQIERDRYPFRIPELQRPQIVLTVGKGMAAQATPSVGQAAGRGIRPAAGHCSQPSQQAPAEGCASRAGIILSDGHSRRRLSPADSRGAPGGAHEAAHARRHCRRGIRRRRDRLRRPRTGRRRERVVPGPTFGGAFPPPHDARVCVPFALYPLVSDSSPAWVPTSAVPRFSD